MDPCRGGHPVKTLMAWERPRSWSEREDQVANSLMRLGTWWPTPTADAARWHAEDAWLVAKMCAGEGGMISVMAHAGRS